jgi:hypothetical protein
MQTVADLRIYLFIYLSVVYLTTLSQKHRLCSVEWKDDRQIKEGKDVERSGRGLI